MLKYRNTIAKTTQYPSKKKLKAKLISIWARYTVLSAHVSYNENRGHMLPSQQLLVEEGYGNAKVNRFGSNATGDGSDYTTPGPRVSARGQPARYL